MLRNNAHTYPLEGISMMKKIIHVVCSIFEQDGKILICRRKEGLENEGKWEFPGGKLENNETLKECGIREIKEELELDTI